MNHCFRELKKFVGSRLSIHQEAGKSHTIPNVNLVSIVYILTPSFAKQISMIEVVDLIANNSECSPGLEFLIQVHH
jgi:hypothetical protein